MKYSSIIFCFILSLRLHAQINTDGNGNVTVGLNNLENSEQWNKVFNVIGNGNAKALVSASGVHVGVWANSLGFYGAPAGGMAGSWSNHPYSLITNKFSRVTIATNGNVGIGITNPLSLLHLNNNGSSFALKIEGVQGFGTGLLLQNNNTSGHKYSIYSANDGSMVMGDESLQKLKIGIWPSGEIAINGNTSIGFAESLNLSDFRLDVNGTTHSRKYFESTFGTHDWGQMHYVLSSTSTGPRFAIGLQYGETPNNGGSDFAIWSYDNNGGFYGKTFTIKRSNGNVGIGTDKPLERFQIGDRFTFQDGGWKGICYNIAWDQNKNANTRIVASSASGIFFSDQGNIIFNTAGSGAAGSLTSDGVYSLIVHNSGQIGIGTNYNITSFQDPSCKLLVDGGIKARKIKVDQQSWADYVFENDYTLKPITELEKFIQQHKHLPEVPTTSEVEKEGLDIGANQALLLKKIEELTLYIIELKRQVDRQDILISELRKAQ